jgi:hypothetical protein
MLGCLFLACLPLGAMGAAISGGARALAQIRLEKMLRDSFSIGGSPLEDTYYACLLNGLEQGLSLDQIREDCAIEAIDLSSRGFGDTQLPGEPDTWPHTPDPEPFDPHTVTMACNSGDALIAGGSSSSKESPVAGYKASDAVKESAKVPAEMKAKDGQIKVGKSTVEGYGFGTHGGKGEKDPESGVPYKGLSQEESMDQKAEAIMKAVEALEKYQKAQEAAVKETDLAKKVELINEAAKLKAEWQKAHEKALEDPNLTYNPSHTADVTPCAEALQTAREYLFECHRTDWKYPGCASLQAATQRCPDPTQVYVDPESGYACMDSIDTEALKTAWVAECEKLVNYGPDGDNPCHPPRFDGKGRFAPQDSHDNFCESTPETYIEPGSSSCIKVFEIKTFGEPDIKKLYVWGLNHLGGPVVVIPDRDPRPPVGPGPGPDPAPSN